jgi:hypothetical protein
MSGDNALRLRVARLIAPDRVDVVEAKHRSFELLGDGAAHTYESLRAAVVADVDVEPVGRRAVIELPDLSAESIQALHRDHPVLAWHRWEFALSEGLAELSAEGLIVQVASDVGGDHPRRGGQLRVSHSSQGRGDSVTVEIDPPAFHANVFRLLRRHVFSPPVDYLDADRFDADIGLGSSGRRTLVESLAALRAGMYLAAASLVGATAESVWFDVGEHLRGQSGDLDQALDDPRGSTARVQEQILAVLSSAGARSPTIVELRSHAELLRAVRNYGVHPRGTVDDRLEEYFNEYGATMLVAMTRRHLTRLRELVAELGF